MWSVAKQSAVDRVLSDTKWKWSILMPICLLNIGMPIIEKIIIIQPQPSLLEKQMLI